MAFEQVRIRLANGQEYGPVSWSAMLQWRQEGRVPNDAFIVDAATGQSHPVSAFPVDGAAQPAAPAQPQAPSTPQFPAAPSGYVTPTSTPADPYGAAPAPNPYSAAPTVTPAPYGTMPTPSPYTFQGMPAGYAQVVYVEYAGFWQRWVAFIIDGLIIYGPLVLLMIPAIIAGGDSDMSDGLALLIEFLGVVAGWLYFALMESSSSQATLGKMALGLKVTDLSGQRITFGKATGRFFGKIVSRLILGIGFIMAAFTERKQALHDLMAGTLVVRK